MRSPSMVFRACPSRDGPPSAMSWSHSRHPRRPHRPSSLCASLLDALCDGCERKYLDECAVLDLQVSGPDRRSPDVEAQLHVAGALGRCHASLKRFRHEAAKFVLLSCETWMNGELLWLDVN